MNTRTNSDPQSLATPLKSTDNHFCTVTNPKPQAQSFQSFSYKFKRIGEQPYIPKFTLQKSQIKTALIKRKQNVDEVVNLDQWSESKPKDSPEKISPLSKAKQNKDDQFILRICREQLQNSNKDVEGAEVMSTEHFQTNKLINYFQVRVVSLQAQQSGILTVGVTNSSELNSFKSSVHVSAKFTTEGIVQIYRNNKKIDSIANVVLKEGDYVGIGLIYHRGEVFITHNGHYCCERTKIQTSDLMLDLKKIHRTTKDFVEAYNCKFYPFIVLHSRCITAWVIFQNASYCFCYPIEQQFASLAKKLVEKQFERVSSVRESEMYGLVLSYFKFYGYDKTNSLFEAEMLSKNMRFYPQNNPTRNKLQHSKIMEEIVMHSKKYEKVKKQKRIKKRLQKTKSNRNKSLKLNEQGSSEIQDEMFYRTFHYSCDRKDSQISESQIQSAESSDARVLFTEIMRSPIRTDTKVLQNNDYLDERKKQENKQLNNKIVHKISKKKQKELQIQIKLEQEKYKVERIHILKAIKQGKIEQALKILEQSFPYVYQHEKYLGTFFKGMLVLKKFKEDGLSAALEYTKSEHQSFSQFENYLFPFYNSEAQTTRKQDQYVFRPLREILFLLCQNNNEEFIFKNQLETFANFVNKVICECSGLMGSSRLQLVLDHFKVVQNQVQQNGIPIGGIDLEAMGQL